MHATNTSLIKSPIIWQADRQPSRLFAAIYWPTLLLSITALWLCPVELFIRLLLMLIVALGGTLNFFSINTKFRLSAFEDGRWQISSCDQNTTGQLASGSYRSMLLIVIALKPEHPIADQTQLQIKQRITAPITKRNIQYAVFWRDSVTPEAFSYLHMRLAMTSSQQLC